MPRRRREWIDDPETAKRIQWAITESRARVGDDPWAAVVLAQVGLEVALAFVVHVLTERQSPEMRFWIERLQADRLSRSEDLALINALVAPSRERIDGDTELWEAVMRHVKRRNDFLHRGIPPTVEEADESVQTCTRFHDRLLRLAKEAARRLDIVFVARQKTLEWATKGERGSPPPDAD